MSSGKNNGRDNVNTVTIPTVSMDYCSTHHHHHPLILNPCGLKINFITNILWLQNALDGTSISNILWLQNLLDETSITTNILRLSNTMGGNQQSYNLVSTLPLHQSHSSQPHVHWPQSPSLSLSPIMYVYVHSLSPTIQCNLLIMHHGYEIKDILTWVTSVCRNLWLGVYWSYCDWIKSTSQKRTTNHTFCLPVSGLSKTTHLLNDSPPQGENFLDLVWSNAKIYDFYVNSRFEGMNLVFAGMNFHVLRYELSCSQVYF